MIANLPQPISIWQPQQMDGAITFVRPEPLPFGDHYAARRTFSLVKKEGGCRICFFGESVAAGYLYAPHVTPAGVLQTQLDWLSEAGRHEVIDLSRTNETLAGLLTTAQQAAQLKPDMLIIFSGNNWNLLETAAISPYHPDHKARQAYAAALQDNGILGPVERAARSRLQQAAVTLDRLADLASDIGAAVLIVVPEVNLADWESRQPVSWLPGAGTQRWYTLLATAEQQLADQKWADAAQTAQAMIALDGSTCPTSYRLLAQAYGQSGETALAEAACRGELEADQYATMAFLSAPRCTPLEQGLLRRAASQHNFSLVDLPAIFATYLPTSLPGRRLFLDYCHLTLEGIHVAMGAVASAISQICETVPQAENWLELVNRLPQPSITPEADAIAKLGAAIHSAHRLLPVTARSNLLAYWCEQALNTSPGIEETMVDLVRVRCGQLPAVLTAAQQRNLASPYPLTLQHGWKYDYLDGELLLAIQSALEKSGRLQALGQVHTLLTKLGQGQASFELACPAFYHWEPLARFYPVVMAPTRANRNGYYRAAWPISRFCLVSDGHRGLELRATWRRPQEGPVKKQVGILVNGTHLDNVPVAQYWEQVSIWISSDYLQPGINELTLQWPQLAGGGEEGIRLAIEQLAAGASAAIHPVFGEIFSLMCVFSDHQPADDVIGKKYSEKSQ